MQVDCYTTYVSSTILPRVRISPRMGIVETTNALPLSSFISRYYPAALTFTHPDTSASYTFSLHDPTTVAPSDLEACLNLLEHTSSKQYENSAIGWSPSRKRVEMNLPDLRYLLVKPVVPSHVSEDAPVEAFISFMITYEDGYEVVYCYEIHLAESLRGCGLGRRLMEVMEEVGRHVGVSKAMLTVFVANEGGVSFYEHLGWVIFSAALDADRWVPCTGADLAPQIRSR